MDGKIETMLFFITLGADRQYNTWVYQVYNNANTASKKQNLLYYWTNSLFVRSEGSILP